jgi:hypothetical protein
MSLRSRSCEDAARSSGYEWTAINTLAGIEAGHRQDVRREDLWSTRPIDRRRTHGRWNVAPGREFATRPMLAGHVQYSAKTWST